MRLITGREWGGAKQIAVFAHIHKIKLEVPAYGMAEQVFDGGGLEQHVIRVLYGNSTKWENQHNRYDLLVPHVDVETAHHYS
eukprot:16012123-Heterocapsa_arctica.AAC.1